MGSYITCNTCSMVSLRLTVCVGVFFLISVDAAPKPDPYWNWKGIPPVRGAIPTIPPLRGYYQWKGNWNRYNRGDWSKWGQRSPCHDGKKIRTRKCNGGSSCLGSSVKTDDCPPRADFDSKGCLPGHYHYYKRNSYRGWCEDEG